MLTVKGSQSHEKQEGSEFLALNLCMCGVGVTADKRTGRGFRKMTDIGTPESQQESAN